MGEALVDEHSTRQRQQLAQFLVLYEQSQTVQQIPCYNKESPKHIVVYTPWTLISSSCIEWVEQLPSTCHLSF